VIRGRLPALAILAGVAMGGVAAGGVAAAGVPTQEEWAGAKRMVPLDGGPTLAYVEAGDPDGPPVLLIHGYTDNSRSWSLLAPHLAGRRLIAVDLRGHGMSGAPACCYGIDTLADDMHRFLDALGITQADVVGHSLGSMTALALAVFHPERVNRLVLVSTALRPGGGPGSWLWDNISTLSFPLDPDGQFMTEWYWNPNPVPADYIDRERAESAAVPEHVWKGVLEALTITDLTPAAPLVTAPTLVLWGDQDGLFDAAQQETVRAALPSARFETVAGFGHNMFWETPERVGATIDTFLGD
jgi:pimeloyl-ACP methyl ester carboxylesterase